MRAAYSLLILALTFPLTAQATPAQLSATTCGALNLAQESDILADYHVARLPAEARAALAKAALRGIYDHIGELQKRVLKAYQHGKIPAKTLRVVLEVAVERTLADLGPLGKKLRFSVNVADRTGDWKPRIWLTVAQDIPDGSRVSDSRVSLITTDFSGEARHDLAGALIALDAMVARETTEALLYNPPADPALHYRSFETYAKDRRQNNPIHCSVIAAAEPTQELGLPEATDRTQKDDMDAGSAQASVSSTHRHRAGDSR